MNTEKMFEKWLQAYDGHDVDEWATGDMKESYLAGVKAGLEEAVETVKKEAREVVLDRDTVEWLLKAITELDKGER